MKKILTMFIAILCLGLLVSCTESKTNKVSIIVPSGTPTLGVADALHSDADLFDYNVVQGSDALVAAFTNANYDIIVAPVNLGAKFYSSLNNFEYVFYQTIVGGCFYLVTSEDITELSQINGKEITVFGANSTPDVIIRSLINYYNLDVKINYVSDVAEANASLISNKSTIIVSAQPSISKFNASGKFNVIDLQAEWKKMSGSTYSIPQAGIFVKKSKLDDKSVVNALNKLNASLSLSTTNPDKLAESGTQIDEALNKIGKETLIKAIPHCNFVTTKNNMAEIEFYFNKLIELNLGQTMGGKLPSEDFYA